MKTQSISKNPLLIIVDMINGFVRDGAMSDTSIQSITPAILNTIKYMKEKEFKMIAFLDSHDTSSLEFNSYPTHCLKDSKESELIDEIKAYEDNLILMDKQSTNGFLAPKFQAYLSQLSNHDSVIVCGCCTDICILQFVLTLNCYFIQNNLNIKIIVPKDMTETFDSSTHPKDYYNEIAYRLMENANIEILDSLSIGDSL